MRIKIFLGWSFIFLICLIPVLLLLRGPASSYHLDYANVTHILGQIFGLVGFTFFTLSFILAARFRFVEDLFGGLDKVYKVHGTVGGLALVFILFHPIFLVLKYIPSNISTAAFYLSPFHSMATDFGIIALVGMLILILISVYSVIRYNYWKVSHKFLAVFFIFAWLHAVLVIENGARDIIFSGYPIYILVLGIVGLIFIIYSIFIKDIIHRFSYRIENVSVHNGQIYDITLVPLKKPMKYKAGQFLFVRFDNKNLGSEKHPFSIASKSNDDKIRIVIKNLGDYTSKLGNLKKGDKAYIYGPFGRFNSSDAHEQVWIAGGIGVTPFIGMAEDLYSKKIKVELYYSVKNIEEMVNNDRFVEISKKANFKYYPWLVSKNNFLTVDVIKKNGKLDGKKFYLCGPESFKNAMIIGLLKEGVSQDNIFSEEFNFK